MTIGEWIFLYLKMCAQVCSSKLSWHRHHLPTNTCACARLHCLCVLYLYFQYFTLILHNWLNWTNESLCSGVVTKPTNTCREAFMVVQNAEFQWPCNICSNNLKRAICKINNKCRHKLRLRILCFYVYIGKTSVETWTSICTHMLEK